MSMFTVHDLHTALEASKPVLQALKESFGFVPNVAGAIAGSPTLLSGFASVFQEAHRGTFSEPEVQVLLLTNAVTNSCRWAAAFHTHLALQNGVSPFDVQAIRGGALPTEPRHAALSALARRLIETRGHVEDERLQAFVAAGFTPEQVLEVILVVAASAITNHVANVAKPPLEPQFQAHVWTGATQ